MKNRKAPTTKPEQGLPSDDIAHKDLCTPKTFQVKQQG